MNYRDPEDISAAERRHEIVTILADGYLRFFVDRCISKKTSAESIIVDAQVNKPNTVLQKHKEVIL